MQAQKPWTLKFECVNSSKLTAYLAHVFQLKAKQCGNILLMAKNTLQGLHQQNVSYFRSHRHIPVLISDFEEGDRYSKHMGVQSLALLRILALSLLRIMHYVQSNLILRP